MSNAFEDIGTQDPILGTEIYNALSLSAEDLAFPGQMLKVKEITEFASKFEDGLSMIRMAMMKKPHDLPAVDHIFTYVNLQSKRFDLKQQLGKLEEELSLYE